jgi:ABC-2 type transport system ATP-binding protein
VVDPSSGYAYVLDQRAGRSRELREQIGFVPSGDRSFYLRLSGLENLVFFARMHGQRRRAARERATELLDAVGLADAARRPVNTYSHGMQKRLSFARALLHSPSILLVDEATHDLDPVAAEQIRALTRGCAGDGTAVLWATQRIEELAGFAERVTVLDRGTVCFAGTVTALAAAGGADRHVIGLGPGTTVTLPELDGALGPLARIQTASDAGHALITLAPGVALGAALAVLTAAGAEVTSCRDERPPIERAFLAVTGGLAP